MRWLNPDTNRAVELDRRFVVGDLTEDFESAPRAFKAATTLAAYAGVLRDSRFASGIDRSSPVEVTDDVARELRDEVFSESSDLVFDAYRIQG